MEPQVTMSYSSGKRMIRANVLVRLREGGGTVMELPNVRRFCLDIQPSLVLMYILTIFTIYSTVRTTSWFHQQEDISCQSAMGTGDRQWCQYIKRNTADVDSPDDYIPLTTVIDYTYSPSGCWNLRSKCWFQSNIARPRLINRSIPRLFDKLV